MMKQQEIQVHEGSIWSIKFSTDDRRLASVGKDHVVGQEAACQGEDRSGHTPGTPTAWLAKKQPVKGKTGQDTLPEHV
jgi:hypothetical protein